MGYKFGEIIIDNLNEEDLKKLIKMKRKHKLDEYKIVITSDRKDYDDLMELANYPERGRRVGTFYFNSPSQLEIVLHAFEGLFYQLFKLNETERFGAGIMDDLVFEDWWDESCYGVCEYCFLRNKSIRNGNNWHYTCRRGYNNR